MTIAWVQHMAPPKRHPNFRNEACCLKCYRRIGVRKNGKLYKHNCKEDTMMRFRVEVAPCGCEKLVNTLATIEITNTKEGPLHERKYDIEATYKRENGLIVNRKFSIIHNRHDGMWVLAQKVTKKIEELEAKDRYEQIEGYLDVMRIEGE